jgi:plasmid stabilization system protein ParE
MAETGNLKDFSVELSPRALRDLERAQREVFDASQSEQVTAAYLRRIAAEINALSIMPSRVSADIESR